LTLGSGARCTTRCRSTCSRCIHRSATSPAISPTPSTPHWKCSRCRTIPNLPPPSERASPIRSANSSTSRQPFAESLPQIQQRHQKYPQPVHEVPVIRGDLGGQRARSFSSLERMHQHIHQRANSTEQVNAVRRGENIEKAAGGIAGDENALRHQLSPCEQLPDQK